MPRNAWSPKRERQYEHIKESELAEGRSSDRAEEIAARTVNRQRAEAGETKNARSRGNRSDAPSRKGESTRRRIPGDRGDVGG